MVLEIVNVKRIMDEIKFSTLHTIKLSAPDSISINFIKLIFNFVFNVLTTVVLYIHELTQWLA